jgi:radical SAM superfamily enzyme YgiQ (UPF0313 family)
MSNLTGGLRGPLEEVVPRPFDKRRAVILIGFQDQANLGLGYLAAVLRRRGYSVVVFDFALDRDEILKAALALEPIVVGFSLIFQFYVDRFRELSDYLRENGVNCHFTMGGHFPSLSPTEAFELVPAIDSIVRYEGELTLLELCDRLAAKQAWQEVAGLVYRDSEGVTVSSKLRPLLADLDELPYPERLRPNLLLGHRAMPLIASRGCIRTCSFCSIHVFYRQAPGKVVRTRLPARVVEEMAWLHREHNVTVFLFQDDDFPLYGPVWMRWANEFVDELNRSGLPRRVIWKINCRADAVDRELLERMRDAGLYVVYMGLESGSEDGLTTLHKQITVEQNVRAVEIIKSLGMLFEYGFMMFDPSSTFDSVRDNLAFLRRIVGDGSAPASFCRMVPYDGTPIKDQLAREGRLRGDVLHPDYDFLDARIDRFFHALNRMVHVSGWIHGIQALTPQLQFEDSEVAVMERLFPPLPGLSTYKESLRRLKVSANELLFRIVDETSYVYSDGKPNRWTPARVRARCDKYIERLVRMRNAFVLRNQGLLLESLSESQSSQPAHV